RQRLRELETQSAASTPTSSSGQLGLFAPPTDHPILDALEGIEPADLSPRQALDILFKLKDILHAS
ncbi:MAG: hypothetical protein HZB57_01750, partial [Gammaproteobacteria bacterium]|nr:hypothetical protein [Gammaproteobacteria bacterium]